jgi:hypothetical protein
LLSKWAFTVWKSSMPLVMTLVPFLVLRNSKSSLTTPFSCFCSWIRLTANVRIIGAVYLFSQEVFPYSMLPHCWQSRCPFQLYGVGRRSFLWRPPGGCIRRQTLRWALLVWKSGRFRWCCAACASDYLEAFILSWLLSGFFCRFADYQDGLKVI